MPGEACAPKLTSRISAVRKDDARDHAAILIVVMPTLSGSDGLIRQRAPGRGAVQGRKLLRSYVTGVNSALPTLVRQEEPGASQTWIFVQAQPFHIHADAQSSMLSSMGDNPGFLLDTHVLFWANTAPEGYRRELVR